MGILKRAGDLVYTFRFLKLLTTDFKNTEAFKLGIIDEKGKKLRKPESSEDKSAYTPFNRLVYNIKKLIPGGKLGSYASALYMIKEHFSISENKIQEALQEVGVDHLDLLTEGSQWFILEDGRLSPGQYKVSTDKLLNVSMDEMVRRKDTVIADEECYPVGNIFGIDVYEMTHRNTNQKVYATVEELLI